MTIDPVPAAPSPAAPSPAAPSTGDTSTGDTSRGAAPAGATSHGAASTGAGRPGGEPDASPSLARTGAEFLRTAAAFVIVVAGLKASASLVVPILLAAFVALACTPGVRALRRRGVPRVLALPLVVLGVLVVMLVLTAVVGSSIARFSASIDEYEASLRAWLGPLYDRVAGLDVGVTEENLAELVDTQALMRLVAASTQEVLAILSNAALILIVVVFMMAEAAGLPVKLRRALGSADADISQFTRVAREVHGYLSVKTAVSLLTGVLVAALVAACGVDFPVLWGLVAFLFNYVPNVGSIIAAVPAVLLGLIQHGPPTAGLVAAGYLAINLVVGNVLEPRWMGRRLGLSPLVVILSLIFWSWVWGPVGMLLSLPLTMIVKIALESRPDLRHVAVLLEPAGAPAFAAPPPRPQRPRNPPAGGGA